MIIVPEPKSMEGREIEIRDIHQHLARLRVFDVALNCRNIPDAENNEIILELTPEQNAHIQKVIQESFFLIGFYCYKKPTEDVTEKSLTTYWRHPREEKKRLVCIFGDRLLTFKFE